MKKASKMGLQMAIESFHIEIWVSLDKVDMREVLTKDADWFPTLGPELRFMYRHWSDLSDQVKFFLHGKEVAAPWVMNPARWKGYEEQRKVKLQNLVRTHNQNALSSEKGGSSYSREGTQPQKNALQEKIVSAKGSSSSRSSNIGRRTTIKVQDEKIIF